MGVRSSKSCDGREQGGRAHARRQDAEVHVDPDKCQGHNYCKAVAPELFELDEYGNAREVSDGTVPPALEEPAYLAESNCPEFAVAIIDT